MHYIYQLLAVILIGTAIGAAFSGRNNVLLFGSLAAIALGIITVAVPSWMPLAVGTVIFLVVQLMQRDPISSRG
ncbi:hypothetical protein [Eoetvoesiella caeni]